MKQLFNKVASTMRLIRSKMYVLVTDREVTVQANFKNDLKGLMMIHAVKSVIIKLKKIVADWEKDNDITPPKKRTKRNDNL
jgi:hypothetical protein